METIAVYWEPIIRTYGFTLQERLFCSRITLPTAALASWAARIEAAGGPDATFRLLWAHEGQAGALSVFLLCDPTQWQKVQSLWRHPAGRTDLATASPLRVDLLSFQGPHFGDRYGIIDVAFKALAREKVPLVAMACSMATIYLVLPSGRGEQGRSLLAAAFEVPTEIRRGKGQNDAAQGDGRS